MKYLSKRSCLMGLALASVMAWSGAALAQGAYPSKPITMILPFPAGGSTDTAGRMMANALTKILGQSVVVENVAGASGAIGMQRLIRAQPDGYTVGVGTIGTHVIVPAISKKSPYDPITQFEPVGMIGSAPMMLVTKPSHKFKDIKEFAAYLKANKGKVNYGSAGVGSMAHYGCVMLLSALGEDVQHIPYRGVAPAYTDLMAGQFDFLCDQPTGALQHVNAGKINAVAVLGNEKIAQLPKLTTASSQGLAGTNVRVWTGLFAPKGTPPEVIKRLNDAMVQAAKDPEMRKQAAASGLDLPLEYSASPGALSAMIVLGARKDAPVLQARKEYLD
jgi:tripartite-type tricarboxylate transporter receptor subunit TctC